MRMRGAVAVWLVLAGTMPAGGAPAARRGNVAPAPESPSAPVLSQDSGWARRLLVAAGGVLLAAAVLGPRVRRRHPEELPVTHSFDEPPGSSHLHGASGTVDFHAPERRHP